MSLDASDLEMASAAPLTVTQHSRFCSGSFVALELTPTPSTCHLISEAPSIHIDKGVLKRSSPRTLKTRRYLAHQRTCGLFLTYAHLSRNMEAV